MTKTEHFQLNQWELSDRIMMEDFNADNKKIEAALGEHGSTIAQMEAVLAGMGNCRIVAGTYTGTGTYNKAASAVKLTFPSRPGLLVVHSGTTLAVIVGMTRGFSYYNSHDTSMLYAVYNEEAGEAYWLSTATALAQMNTQDTVYTYYAFL